ncbi:MAG: membrane protein insertase YidC [Polyangiales bacterium]
MEKRNFIMIGLLAALMAFTFFSQEDPPAETAPDAETATSESGDSTEAGETQDATPRQPATLSESDLRARTESEEFVTVHTDVFDATFSNLNTGLVSFKLTEEKYLDGAGEPIDMVTTTSEAYYGLQLEVPGIPIPVGAVWTAEQIDERTVRFEWRGNGFIVSRRIQAGQNRYQLWSTTRVRNDSASDATFRVSHRLFHYTTREQEESGFIGRPPTAAAFGICSGGENGEDIERAATAELVKDPRGFGGDVGFASIADSYFATAMASVGGPAERCVVGASRRGGSVVADTWEGSLVEAELRYARTTLAPGEESLTRTLAYVGPSDRTALRNAGHGLPGIVDLGWFSLIANGFNDLLTLVYGFVGNWGLAIILMTLGVKMLFFPITMRSFRSMGRMRQLKPQIDALNEKYGDDREKKGAAMMELYRKEGVSPISGCLPSLLQMPVWFALYRSLSTNLELYHAPFVGFWTDLSAPDPYFVLPILVAVLMHLQQRLTPNTMDSSQAKMMMYLMPILIGGFMLFLPAGLCLYMVTNSTLTMIQQRAIYAKLDAEKDAKPDPDSSDDDEADKDNDPNNDPEPGPSLQSSSASAKRRTLGSRKKKQRNG